MTLQIKKFLSEQYIGEHNSYMIHKASAPYMNIILESYYKEDC